MLGATVCVFALLCVQPSLALTTEPANCITLIANKLNFFWQLEGDDIHMALEGKFGGGSADRWMAFGVPPNPDTVAMVGADVTVVGFIEGAPYAYDYFLSCKPRRFRYIGSLFSCLFVFISSITMPLQPVWQVRRGVP